MTELNPLTVAVQMDPMEGINIKGDSTFHIMLAGQARGHRLYHYLAPDLTYRDGRVLAKAHPVKVQKVDGDHFAFGEPEMLDLGRDVDVAAAQRAAELCAINIIAQAKAALGGDLGRIRLILKLNGFVASMPDFTEQHLVINGASNLIAEVLGEPGRHARAAVGMAALPLNASVEIDAIIEIEA